MFNNRYFNTRGVLSPMERAKRSDIGCA